MFDKEQIEQYRSIKAPESLKARVMSKENKPHKIISFPRQLIAVAACAAVIIAGVIGFGGNGIEVSMVQNYAAASGRSISKAFVFDIDVDKAATVTVSDGEIQLPGSLRPSDTLDISGKTQIEWIVEGEGDYTMTVESGRKTQQYSFSFNGESGKWELEEK